MMTRQDESRSRSYLPAILSALVVILLAAGYAAFWFLVLDEADVVLIVKVIITVVSAGVIAGVSWALFSRIRELKGGQEDDLGKY